MKKMVSLYIAFMILFISGCEDKKIDASIQMKCDGIESNFNVEKGNTISCNLSDNNYEFKIKSIKDTEIVLESNNYNLTDDKDINKEVNSFKLSKDKELSLFTKTNNENIIIIWK